MEVCTDGRMERCEPGDVIVINSNDGHASHATQPHTTVLLLHIDAGYLAGFTQDGSVPRFSCRSTGNTRDQPGFARLRTLLARMMLASDRPGPGGKAAWEAGLLSVVATLFDHFPPEPSQEPATDLPTAIESHQALRREVAYMDQSFRERITLELLAQHSGFSPGYLSQLFPQHVGMTFSKYLTRARPRQADLVFHQSHISRTDAGGTRNLHRWMRLPFGAGHEGTPARPGHARSAHLYGRDRRTAPHSVIAPEKSSPPSPNSEHSLPASPTPHGDG